MSKVLNKYHLKGTPPNSVYIGRPSIYGNPFSIGDDGDRDEVVKRYEEYLCERIEYDLEFREAVKSLHGKDLICFCAPKKCHGNILLEYCEYLNKKTE